MFTDYVHLQGILSHLLIITAGFFFLEEKPLLGDLVFLDLLLSMRVVSNWCGGVSWASLSAGSGPLAAHHRTNDIIHIKERDRMTLKF